MILEHQGAKFDVEKLVAETEQLKFYLCTEVETGRPCLLQVTTSPAFNGELDRAAFILRELRRTADQFEAEYAKQGTGRKLSYEYLFPEVVASFVAADHGGRRVNILAFAEVDDILKLVPLSNLVEVDHLRVDLKTSAWIMGRLLKLLTFVHDEGVVAPNLSGNNILLLPERHFAITLDWSTAQTQPGKVAKSHRSKQISTAARTVLKAVGCHPTTLDFPYETELDDGGRRYLALVRQIANGRFSSAERAHGKLYELLDELYGRKFHPFTTLPL